MIFSRRQRHIQCGRITNGFQQVSTFRLQQALLFFRVKHVKYGRATFYICPTIAAVKSAALGDVTTNCSIGESVQKGSYTMRREENQENQKKYTESLVVVYMRVATCTFSALNVQVQYNVLTMCLRFHTIQSIQDRIYS